MTDDIRIVDAPPPAYVGRRSGGSWRVEFEAKMRKVAIDEPGRWCVAPLDFADSKTASGYVTTFHRHGFDAVSRTNAETGRVDIYARCNPDDAS
jgi:hypothetical protein